jgi:membrane protease YdiL (CAAX protease family)
MDNTTKVEPKKSEPADGPDITEVKKVPWSPLAAVLYAAFIYFAAQFLASLIIIVYPHLRHWDKATSANWLNTSVFAQFWYVLAAEALTFGAIWWFLRHRKSSLRTIGWRGLRWVDVVYALAGFALYFVGYAIVLTIATHIFPSINVDQETVFRGFVFSGLKNKLPFIYAAIGTSLLFASAHLQYGSGKPLLWIAALDTFTLSMVLCYLRQKTGGLWAGIFLHALKNGIAFVSLFLLHAH